MRCKQSVEEKFENIYEKYKNDVYRTSLHITGNAAEAEEITQKIFCKMFEYIEHVDEEYVGPYLVRAAKNMSLNWLRDTKKERDGVHLDDMAESGPMVESVEDTYLQREKEGEIKEFSSELMQRLYEENESWYQCMNLVYGLGISHTAAAKMLGISKSVLYSKIHRAKKWIIKQFGKEYFDL